MAMNFPNSPTDGQVHTEQGMTFVWKASASAWVMLGGESEIADPATIIRSGFPTESWQVVGDMLICTGVVTTSTSAGAVVTFPKAFKTVPSLVALPVSAISNDERSVHAFSLSETQVDLVAFNGANARIAVAVRWVAVGEALDADKTPKVVQTIGGLSSFATMDEAKAGVAQDKVMSPYLVRGVVGSIMLAEFEFNGQQFYPFDVPPECYGFEYDFTRFTPSVNLTPLMVQFGDASSWETGAAAYVNAQVFMFDPNTIMAATSNLIGAYASGSVEIAAGAEANAGWGRAVGFNFIVPSWGHMNGSGMVATKIGTNPVFEQKADVAVRTINKRIWNRARFGVPSGVITTGSALVRGLLK